MPTPRRLIIGISGSSGIIYAIRLLEMLRTLGIETHVVATKAAQLTRAYETTYTLSALQQKADIYYAIQDIAAPIASGSFQTMGMIIVPCSMNTLGEVAHGLSSNLLTRAADVVLKERRRLVLLPREAPLHQMHLQNMLAITQNGGIIFPPVPAFYHHPQTITDLIDDTLGRVLDLFHLEHPFLKRWDHTNCKKGK